MYWLPFGCFRSLDNKWPTHYGNRCEMSSRCPDGLPKVPVLQSHPTTYANSSFKRSPLGLSNRCSTLSANNHRFSAAFAQAMLTVYF